MDLHDMYYLLALDKYGSIGKAAEELHISQPALSKFVQHINRSYDERVFVKKGHHLQTTEFGKLLIKYAEKFTALENDMFQDIQSFHGSGTFRIGIPSATGRYLISHAFTRFGNMHPEADLQYVQIHSTLGPDLIRTGELEAAICAPPEDDVFFSWRSNYREEMVLAVNKRHPIVKTAKEKKGFAHPWVDLRQMQDSTFILMDKDSWPRIAAEMIFKQCDFYPGKVTYTTDMESAVQMASAGFGATILIDKYHLFLLDMSRMAILSCGREPIYHDSAIVWRKSEKLPVWADDLFDCIQTAFRELEERYQNNY